MPRPPRTPKPARYTVRAFQNFGAGRGTIETWSRKTTTWKASRKLARDNAIRLGRDTLTSITRDQEILATFQATQGPNGLRVVRVS